MTKRATWKAYERRICKRFGMTRTGPTGKDDHDCTGGPWSIEIRKRKRLPWAMLQRQVAKAEARAKDGQIPIFIGSMPGDDDDDSLVVMRLKTLQEWFVS